MTGKLVIPKRFYFIIAASLLAIVLVSFTIGREMYADKTESIYSFAIIHFSGYLFFLLMPVEIAFLYYLPFYSNAELIAAALGTAIAAQLIDYSIGLLIRPRKIRNWIGQNRITKAEALIRKYGLVTIFLFNLLPLSSPVMALVAGMIKINFRHFLLASSLGLLLKYLLLSWFF